MKRLTFLFLLSVCTLAGINNVSAIEWRKDLDKALADAKTQNKPVFAFFYHYLYYQNPTRQREDFLVWESPIVKRACSGFIAVKVDVEGKEDIESKYRVMSFPSLLFFDPQGRELYPMRIEDRNMKRDVVAPRMEDVLENIDNFALVEQLIKTNDSNPEMVLKYANGLRDRGMFDRAEEQYYRLLNWKGLTEDRMKEVKSSYVNLFFYRGAAELYGGDPGRAIDIMERFIAKNPKSEALPQARMLLGMAKYEGGAKSDGEKILKELLRDKKAKPLHDQIERFFEEIKSGRKRR